MIAAPSPTRLFTGALLAACIALAAVPAAAATAAELYAKHCIACHQAEGEGTPGIAPTIAGVLAKRAATAEGREFFPRLLINGMSGMVASQGMRFFGNMPSMAALADAELAAIINHVLSAFNSSTVELTAEAFAAARQAPLPPGEVHKLRERLLALTRE